MNIFLTQLQLCNPNHSHNPLTAPTLHHSQVNFKENSFFCVLEITKKGWHLLMSKPLLSFTDVIFFAFLPELDRFMHISRPALLTHSKWRRRLWLLMKNLVFYTVKYLNKELMGKDLHFLEFWSVWSQTWRVFYCLENEIRSDAHCPLPRLNIKAVMINPLNEL